MGLAVGLLLIVLLMALACLAFLITAIVFVVVGANQKKKGGKGTLGKVGIGLLMVPLLVLLCIGGTVIWQKVMIKCVADEWRFTSINAGEGSAVRKMLSSVLVSIDDGDMETFKREFTLDIRNDRHFDDVVDDFFDELDDLDVELDPDEFLADWGESMFFDTYHYHGKYRYDIGLEQFIVCTEDKIDELYEIIEDDDADIYLDVL